MSVRLEEYEGAGSFFDELSGSEVGPDRKGAAFSLQADGREEDIAVLLGWMESGPAEVRVAVATALGLLGETSAIEPLAGLLSDDDLEVRRAAAVALCRLGDPRAASALWDVLAAMSLSDDAGVRCLAARTLRAVPTVRSAELLEALTGDLDPDVRADAAESLRAHRTRGVAPAH